MDEDQGSSGFPTSLYITALIQKQVEVIVKVVIVKVVIIKVRR